MVAPQVITIPIDTELAQAYLDASPEEKQKIQAQLAQVLRKILPATSPSLQNIAHELSQRAKERGMTPEILEELLKEDE